MIEKYFSRDSFISEIYRKALTNKKIFFLSADFGAPSLDIFRKKLPNQFLHMGISEQNMIDVAIGLAIKKKNPLPPAPKSLPPIEPFSLAIW